MLYIVNGDKFEKVSAEQVARDFELDDYVIKQLKSKAIFRQKPKRLKRDRANPNIQLPNSGTMLPANFSFVDSKGIRKFLHYAESDVPNRTTGKPLLEPRKVSFKGSSFTIANNFDKALFFYLHKFNINSPFNEDSKQGKDAALYSFVNKRKQAQENNAKIDHMERMFAEFAKLSETEIKFISRALNLVKSVDDMEQEEIRYALRQYAVNNPEDFLVKIGLNKALHMKGRILNLIDRNFFEIRMIAGSRQWYVTKGSLKGQSVGDQMTNKFQVAEDHLVDTITNDLDSYADLIREVYSSQTTVDDTNEKVVASGLLDDLDEVQPKPSTAGLPDYNDKKAVAAYLKMKDIPASITNQQALISLLKTGQINKDNVYELLKDIKLSKA